MRILVVGSGGREHALVWKLKQSSHCSEIFCAPGNAGISEIAECVNIHATDIKTMVNFAKQNSIDLTVIGPDDPLVLGMVDAFESEGLRVFGPRKDAAMIEGSKVFAKELMNKYDIPTAAYKVFNDSSLAIDYLKEVEYPIVIKADGLALGKGVIIVKDFMQALDAIENIMNKKVFGDAGNKIVVEEFIEGNEVSVLAFTDGNVVIPMFSAKDHKKAFDFDMGPNTGGMGVIVPNAVLTPELSKKAYEKVFVPTLRALNNENRCFKGILYFGLMIVNDDILVLEYNARFGDPETQALLPLLQTDLVEIFDAIIDGDLSRLEIHWIEKASVNVVIASRGYPATYETGKRIFGLDLLKQKDEIYVFHSGTKRLEEDCVTNGGRVLSITGIAENLEKARDKVYDNIQKIKFDGMHYRKDIGKDIL